MHQMKTKAEYYKLAVENAPIHIILTDADGKILYANEGVENITGFKLKEILGKTPREWGQQMSPEFYKNFWNAIKEKKEVFSGELVNRRKNGEKYIAKATIKPIVEKGNVVGFVGIEQDVTLLRKTQNRLKNAVTKLKKSNAMKDMFMDIMRHDILNPLTVIQSWIDMIVKDKKKLTKGIPPIRRSVDTTLEIIENAKKYGKLEDAKSLDTEQMDIKKMIANVCEQVKPRYEKAKIRLTNSVASQKIMANPLLAEVFLNLLTNALKYAKSGKKVIVTSEKHDNMLTVSVTDFGDGIEDQYKKKIFDRFSRKKKEGVQGTGLGLSIVSKIVGLHKGNVWVEDNPKGGSIFKVQLPISRKKPSKAKKKKK